ncbi:hypothetical protein GCM10009872_62640 [Actinopolymorpha rutila]
MGRWGSCWPAQAPIRAARRDATAEDLSCIDMAEVVLRVRFTGGGEHIDLTYDEPHIAEVDQVIEHVVTQLAQDSGVLRTRHGDRLVVLYGRGVAALEVTPRGAVL